MQKIAVITALSILFPAVAFAQGGDIELYGQINKTLMYFDDGIENGNALVDNDSSSSRFGLRGSTAAAYGLTASYLVEVQVQSGDSGGLTQPVGGGHLPEPAAGGMNVRHGRIGLSGDWGTVFIGRTSTATDTLMETDLAPAADVTNTGASYFGGGLQVNVNGAPSGLYVDDFIDNFDGIRASSLSDRMGTVRYDSPLYNGLQARAAVVQGGAWDASLVYNKKYAQTAVYGALAYVNFNTASVGGHSSLRDQWAAIVSARHQSGFGATVAQGFRDGKGPQGATGDARFTYVKGGYGWGMYGAAVEYGSYTGASSHTHGNGLDAEVLGAALQVDLGGGVSTAAYWKTFMFDLSGAEDIDVMGLNLRIKF